MEFFERTEKGNLSAEMCSDEFFLRHALYPLSEI